LTLSGRDIQLRLSSGRFSSIDLVNQYLDHIHKYNDKLNMLVEVAPKEAVLDTTRRLDEERANRKVRGPLHRVPIVIKDSFATHASLSLKSTGGSYAFVDLQPKSTAPAIQRLLDTEGAGMPCGWSAMGGQTQSQYVNGGWDPREKFGGHSGPGGSSSGSACAVAAGFVPVSVGMEIWGSLIMPATQANVFTLKPNRGRITNDGIMPVSDILGVAGPMARAAVDIAHALDGMFGPEQKDYVRQDGYSSKATGSWEGLKLGAVKTSDWKIDSILAEPDEDCIKFPILFAERSPLSDVMSSLISEQAISTSRIVNAKLYVDHNFVKGINDFLDRLESTSVKTVEELVNFNDEHADIEMPPEAPNQDVLLGSLKAEPWDEDRLHRLLAEGVEVVRKNGIDKYLERNDVNVILGPAGSWLTDFACVASYPSAMLPLYFWKKNGRAFGI
ncbi:amidase signature enzyme, partial [Lentithecium fluviatile CBS 122367]